MFGGESHGELCQRCYDYHATRQSRKEGFAPARNIFVATALTTNEPQHCVDGKISFFLLLHLFGDTLFVSANSCGVLDGFIVAKADMRTQHIFLQIEESNAIPLVWRLEKDHYSQFGSGPRSGMHQARRSTCFRQGAREVSGNRMPLPAKFWPAVCLPSSMHGDEVKIPLGSCMVTGSPTRWQVNVEEKKSPPMCHPGWPKVQLLEVKNARNAAADSPQIFTQMFCGTVVMDRNGRAMGRVAIRQNLSVAVTWTQYFSPSWNDLRETWKY